MDRYSALLIGNSIFEDDPTELQELRAPRNDVAILRDALTDKTMGLFDKVDELVDRRKDEIFQRIKSFASGARHDDQLLLYYSGHGILDDRYRLHLAASDTKTENLWTAVRAADISELLNNSKARTVVILLDCCHSGAYKGDSGALYSSVDTSKLAGSGRFVVTSCHSGELAADANHRNGTSLFTKHLVDGLMGRVPDHDGDGRVDVNDVFSYVSDHLKKSEQTPHRSFSGSAPTPALARRPPPDDADAAAATGRRRKSKVRRPLIRMDPKDGAEQRLSAWVDGPFERAIELARLHPRSIAPFIGPGTLQTDPEREEILWDRALDRVLDENDRMALFVRSLLADRVQSRTLRIVEPSTEADRSVSGIRIALARLAEQATAMFGRNALERAVPFNLWDSHEVFVEPGHEPLPELDTVLGELKRHRDAGLASPLLGGERLQTRLSELRKNLEATEGLSGSAVAWLTDLFWHSVIFDSPLYPHVTELSLQVSLLAGRKLRPTRRIDPACAVVRSGLRSLGEATARSVERGYEASEPASGARRRLYRAIAEVLHADYARWVARGNAHFDDAIPLALATTFDLEMERGLAACGRRYEVAIPIYIRAETYTTSPGDEEDPDRKTLSKSEEAVRWLVGRFDPMKDPVIGDLICPAERWRLASSLRALQGGAIDLAGPLLLKLNGSPSHLLPGRSAEGLYDLDLPELKHVEQTITSGLVVGHPQTFGFAPRTSRTSVSIEIEHAISLGEYDFLQLSRVSQFSFDRIVKTPNNSESPPLEDGLPGVLVDQILDADRFWMLLGHRFADWNSRTQIHTYIAHEAHQGERGCAVSLHFDKDRIRFLDWLGITHADGPMSLLIEPLEQVASTLRTKA